MAVTAAEWVVPDEGPARLTELPMFQLVIDTC